MIFAIFSPYKSALGADDQSGPLFLISQGIYPSFIMLPFRNATKYCNTNARINSGEDHATPDTSLVGF